MGRALAQYFIVRFRPSGWGGFFFFMIFTFDNPNIGQPSSFVNVRRKILNFRVHNPLSYKWRLDSLVSALCLQRRIKYKILLE